jgi:hypothetical protein
VTVVFCNRCGIVALCSRCDTVFLCNCCGIVVLALVYECGGGGGGGWRPHIGVVLGSNESLLLLVSFERWLVLLSVRFFF